MKTVWKVLAWISLCIGLFMLVGIPVTLTHSNYSRSDIPLLATVGVAGVFLFIALLSVAKVIDLLEKLVEQTKPATTQRRDQSSRSSTPDAVPDDSGVGRNSTQR
jgi:hypothetical protein